MTATALGYVPERSLSLNRTDMALLALIAAEPRSGYDIRQAVAEQLGHFWNESVGNIYPRLKRLHREGLLTKETVRQQSRPDRHVYSITAAGRRALHDWFDDPIQPQPPRNELLLKLFFGRLAHASTLARQIADYRAQHAATAKKLDAAYQRFAREAASRPDLRFWLLTLRAGILSARTAVAWADEALFELEQDLDP